MNEQPILLSPPHLTGTERDHIAEALDSGWIALLGPQVDAFESDIAAATGNDHALAVASGTAAIHLALLAIGVGPGDTVLCSSLTFVASAAPIRYCGADPVFVDSSSDTWNMDPRLLDRAIRELISDGRSPKAAVVVDIFGQSADYERIEKVCDRYGVTVVEDAAEALGGTYRDRPIGGAGRVAILSFNGNKIITTSGGGALVSSDRDIIERALFLANQAQDPAEHYEHSVIGYNYRMSNVLAAVGRAQVAHLEERVLAKRAIFDRYESALSHVQGLEFMPEAEYGHATRWLSVLTLDRGNGSEARDRVLNGLATESIEARPAWKPMHMQPVFSGSRYFGGSVSERIFRTGLCLPSGTALTTEDQNRVVDAVLRHS